MEAKIDDFGLDAIGLPDRPCNGTYARMRKFELASTINRWRNLKM